MTSSTGVFWGIFLFVATYVALAAPVADAFIWKRTFSGTARSSDQRALSVTLDANGDAIAVGLIYNEYPTWPFPNRTDMDFFAAKVSSSDGQILWQRVIDGEIPLGEHRSNSDFASAVAVDHNGDAVIAGNVNVNGQRALTVVKLSGFDGSIVWVARLDGGAQLEGHPRSIATDNTGNIFICLPTRPDSAFAVAKLSSADGAVIWEQAFGRGDCDPVAVDANGDLLAVGSFAEDSFDLTTAAVFKFAGSDGAELWRWRSLPGTWTNKLAVASSGDVAAAGRLGNGGTSYDFYVIKLSGSDGSQLWSYARDGTASVELENPFSERARSVAINANGDVLATGDVSNDGLTCGSVSCNADILVTRLDGVTGTLLWERQFDGMANRFDAGNAIAIGTVGDVAVAGSTQRTAGEGGQNQFFVLKLDGSTGGVVWSEEIGSGDANGAAVDVAMDPANEPIAVGVLPGSQLFGVAKMGRRSQCKLKVANLDTPPGDDTLTMKGTIPLAHPFSPPIDPIMNGIRLRLQDSGGTPVVDVNIPGGAFDILARKGWTSNPKRTAWRYQDAAGINGGITKVLLRDKSIADRGGLIVFTITGRQSSYAVALGSEALRVIVTFDAAAQQRGEIQFNAAGQTPPRCEFEKNGEMLKCG